MPPVDGALELVNAEVAALEPICPELTLAKLAEFRLALGF